MFFMEREGVLIVLLLYFEVFFVFIIEVILFFWYNYVMEEIGVVFVM